MRKGAGIRPCAVRHYRAKVYFLIMSEKESPRFGPIYRENRDVVRAESARLLEDFEVNFDSNLFSMFGIEGASEVLNAEEKGNLLKIAEHVTKRLTVSALSSPTHVELLEEAGPVEVIRAGVVYGPRLGVGHDILHATVAYARSNGETLQPAYDRARSQEASRVDAVAIGEEMMVTMFRLFSRKDIHPVHGSKEKDSFLLHCFRGGDPFEWSRSLFRLKEKHGSLLNLKKTDPIEYFAHLHEAEWNITDLSLPYDYLRTSKDPAYRQLMTNLYSAAKSPEAGPEVGLREFFRIYAPLLEKLRQTV